MRPRIGISACLLGERVRYDGAHKLSAALAGDFAGRVEWVPVCPEVGAGMGVPREKLHILGTADAPRLVTHSGSRDWTDEMNAFVAAEIARLTEARICGFVLKSKSPSCGLREIPVSGAGVFARAVTAAFPGLPVADEVDLTDPDARAAFADAAVAWARERGML
jgi:uncharacterized protein YbbK (DUF523 family)